MCIAKKPVQREYLKACSMIKGIIPFLIFGTLIGFCFWQTVFWQRVIKNKLFSYITDFLLPLKFALCYFCLLVSYNNGQFRYYYILLIVLGIIFYSAMIHYPLLKISSSLSIKLIKIKASVTNLYKCKKNKKRG